MNYKVKTIPRFEKQAKRLLKKHASLKGELLALVQSLKKDPEQGTSLGNSCYKIRIGIASKGKGKSGGARLITHIAIKETTVYLVSIYDKSEIPDINDKELKELLKQIE